MEGIESDAEEVWLSVWATEWERASSETWMDARLNEANFHF